MKVFTTYPHNKIKVITSTVLVLLSLSLYSCKEDPVSSSNPYAGNWAFTVTGGATGTGQFTVDNNGKFNFLINFTSNGNTVQNTIDGKILENGTVSEARIYYNLNSIGSITGTFRDTIGTGSYSGNYSGVWGAIKLH